MPFRPYIIVSFLIVFIASFTLFFIFDSLNKLAEECKVKSMPICVALTSFTLPMLIILLLISGLVMMITLVAYLLVSKSASVSLWA